MSAFGEPPYGDGSYGGDRPTGDPTITGISIGESGPNITTNWTATQTSDALPQQRARLQFYASDYSVLYFDTGWFTSVVASGSPSSFVVDAVESGIPTDTGTGSVNPTLHIVVRVFSSPTTVPDDSGWFNTADSTAFDIQWGVCSLSWSLTDTTQISPSTGLTFSWVFSSTRGFTQGSYDAQIRSLDGATLYWDSGVITGTGNTETPSFAFSPDSSYQLALTASNTEGVPAPTLMTIIIVGAVSLPVGTPVGGPLQRFLSMIGIELDLARSWLEQLMQVNNPATVPGQLLPAMAGQLGVAYERSIGAAQTRKLLSNIVHEYKTKGTYSGIAGISTDVTGWSTAVTCGPNLMLSAAQVLSTSTSGQTVALISGAANVAPPTPPGYTGAFGPTAWPTTLSTSTKPVWAETAFRNSGSVAWTPVFSSQGVSALYSSGVPIPAGSTVASVDVWVWVGNVSSAPSFQSNVLWFNSAGTVIGTASVTGISCPNNSWTNVSITNTSVPAGTVWGVFTIQSVSSITMAAGSIIEVAMAELVLASTLPTIYKYPRDIIVSLSPNRTNLTSNPSFESNVSTGWVSNGTKTVVSGTFYDMPGVPNPGTHSLEITATSAGSLTVSTTVPLSVITEYTGSAYVRPSTTARSVTATLQPLNVSSVAVGAPFVGSAMMEQAGTWVRPFESILPIDSIDSAATQLELTITWAGVGIGESHYIDAALVEEGWHLQPYFDGSVYEGSSVDSDYFWQTPGTPAGPSYYYSNYANKTSRLAAVLTGATPIGESSPMSSAGFLPLGTTYTISTLGS